MMGTTCADFSIYGSAYIFHLAENLDPGRIVCYFFSDFKRVHS